MVRLTPKRKANNCHCSVRGWDTGAAGGTPLLQPCGCNSGLQPQDASSSPIQGFRHS